MRSLSVPILDCGALVDVEFGVCAPQRAAMLKAGRQPPPPTFATLLIDTGASHTFVDEGVMRILQLQATSTARYHSSSTQGLTDACSVYDVALLLGSVAEKNALRFDPMQVMANPFINQPHQGLLGRDILDRLQLHWNGPTRRLVITYA